MARKKGIVGVTRRDEKAHDVIRRQTRKNILMAERYAAAGKLIRGRNKSNKRAFRSVLAKAMDAIGLTRQKPWHKRVRRMVHQGMERAFEIRTRFLNREITEEEFERLFKRYFEIAITPIERFMGMESTEKFVRFFEEYSKISEEEFERWHKRN